MQLGKLERMLLVFTEVRPGEGGTAVALQAAVFLLLAANYFVKPARDGLLAVTGVPGISDMELRAYSSFGQSILLLVLIPLYARLSARLDRRRLVTRVTLFFVVTLVGFWSLQPGLLVDRVPYLGIAFYLWVGIFNVFVVAQFWAFAADLYARDGGTRLLPLIGVGAAAGAAVGAWLTRELVSSGVFDTYALLLSAAALLAASLSLTRFADSRGPIGPRRQPSPPADASTAGALRLVLGNRFLLTVAASILLVNWVKTNSDNVLFAIVQEVLEAERESQGLAAEAAEAFVRDRTTAFYGDLFFWVNAVGLVMQAFLASRILQYAGFGALLLLLPAISLASYSALALFPSLQLFRVSKIAEDSANYSVHNTALQVLWLPTSREMKYKAKAAIDTIFVRFGDGLAALTTFAGIHLLGFPVTAFFALNACLAAIWVVCAVSVARHYATLSARQ